MDIDDFLRFLSHTEVCEIKHLVSNPLKNNRFFEIQFEIHCDCDHEHAIMALVSRFPLFSKSE